MVDFLFSVGDFLLFTFQIVFNFIWRGGREVLDVVFNGDTGQAFLGEAMDDFINFGAGDGGGFDKRGFGRWAVF